MREKRTAGRLEHSSLDLFRRACVMLYLSTGTTALGSSRRCQKMCGNPGTVLLSLSLPQPQRRGR